MNVKSVLTYTKEGIKIDKDYFFIIPPEYDYFILVNEGVVNQEIGGYPYVLVSDWKWHLIKAILRIPDKTQEYSYPALSESKPL